MKLTTKGRYAVTTLLALAQHAQMAPLSISEVAKRHQISATYLERLACMLRAQGLIKSIRGAQGGYQLARAADEITIAEIMQAVNENIDTTRCKGKANCRGGHVCVTHALWDQLNQKIYGFLKGITLQDLVKDSKQIEVVVHA